ncbi:MAG TPA: hypothetical protein V6C85_28960 [Allocoleopsis sp.]
MKISNLHLHDNNSALEHRTITLPIFSVFNRGLQQLIQYLNSGNKLQVWTKIDRDGKITWHAYDPISERRVVRESEVEMRAWLEERYYH